MDKIADLDYILHDGMNKAIQIISKGCQGIQDSELTIITSEEFMKEYLSNPNMPRMYDANGFRLITKPTRCFMYKGVYFAIAVASGTYKTFFNPFNSNGIHVEANKALLALGVNIPVLPEWIDKFGLTKTSKKQDGYVYTLSELEENFNAPGRGNSRRKIRKMKEQFIIDVTPVNSLTKEQWDSISELENYWFEVMKQGHKDYKDLLDVPRKRYKPSTVWDNHYAMFFTDSDGKVMAYSITEVQDDRCIEYYRKSRIKNTSFEYITLATLSYFNDMHKVTRLDFGPAATYVGSAAKPVIECKGLIDAKSSLPHELYWTHFVLFDSKKWHSTKFKEKSNDLF